VKIGEYLVKQLQATGLRHVFGIQGDYVLNFYSQLYKSRLKLINTCDEQGAGFAADAYARVTGFGAVCVTYGVGGLKLANSTAQAFAELSPVCVISGAPGMAERKHDPLLHHKTKRPGYIESPRDMADVEIDEPKIAASAESLTVNQAALDEALREVLDMLNAAKRPIIIAGVEVHRFNLQPLFLEFLKRSGLPFVTGVLSKSVVSENHPQYVGVYAGGMSPEHVREAVENSDCVVALGPYVTDLATGIFTHHIDISQSVVIMPDSVLVKHHNYPDIDIKHFLECLNKSLKAPKKITVQPKKHELIPFVPQAGKKITVDRLFACVNTFLDDDTTVIAEPGDPLFGSLDLRVYGMTEFISPAYYASIGFTVPASIGVQFAAPNRRPLVLVGDGSFQMTAMELSVSARYGLSPIVIVFNNGGYGTFRPMIDGTFNDIQPWKYADIVNIIGKGKGYVVSTEDELSTALSSAKKNSSSPSIIDVHLGKHDFSERLRKLTDTLKSRL